MKFFWLSNSGLYRAGFVIIVGLIAHGCNKPTDPESETQAEAKAPIAAVPATAEAVDDNRKVFEYILDNGLKLIVKPDHRAPVVVAQIWYKAGSSYEANGTTGVAHLLEHMMFKGTNKRGPNEFSKIISANGGSENAFTGADYTAYFQQLEKSRLPISFELEAERMQSLLLSAEEFGKEIKVVMEERRMRTDDKPKSLAYEQFVANAFVNSPYHHPVIGWMDDLQNMTVDDAQQWYRNYYAPNNATLVVVGDVDPAATLVLAKKYYGPIKSKPIPKIKPQKEIEQMGIRRMSVKAPAQLPYLIMGYKVPVVKTASEEWEPYALEMLAYVLDGSSSSRFSKHLIRGSEVASSVGAGYDLYSRLEDLFLFDGIPAHDSTVDDLEQAIREQIRIVKSEFVSEAELKRIKAQIVAGKVYELDSVFYQAMQIGTLETVGLDWRLLDQYVDKIRTVTPQQIQDVAKKYLIDDHLTIAILDPQPTNAPGGSHAQAH
jgi:zinc protease